MKKRVAVFLLAALLIFVSGCTTERRSLVSDAAKSKNVSAQELPYEQDVGDPKNQSRGMSEKGIEEDKKAEDWANENLPPEEIEEEQLKEEVKKPVTIDIVMMGDICFGSNFGKQKKFDRIFREKGSRYFLEKMEPYLSQADLRIANLENVFTDATAYQPGKKYTYKAYSKDYINVLTVNSIDYVNVVNNHMGDYLQRGFDDTLGLLEEKGIKYFGTNYFNSSNPEMGSVKVDKVEIFEKDGFVIGLMGHMGFNSSYPSRESIANNIKELREAGADFIISSLHGGGQNTTQLTSKQIELAHMMIDEGADMIYGHHPHMLQKTEIYKGKKIYYSLGNFLFIDYSAAKQPESVMVRLKVTRSESGEITTEYEDIPVLWTGTESTNIFRPTITNIPKRVEKIRKILSGELSI